MFETSWPEWKPLLNKFEKHIRTIECLHTQVNISDFEKDITLSFYVAINNFNGDKLINTNFDSINLSLKSTDSHYDKALELYTDDDNVVYLSVTIQDPCKTQVLSKKYRLNSLFERYLETRTPQDSFQEKTLQQIADFRNSLSFPKFRTRIYCNISSDEEDKTFKILLASYKKLNFRKDNSIQNARIHLKDIRIKRNVLFDLLNKIDLNDIENN